MFRNLFVAIPIAVLAVGGSTACATKKFVRTSVGEVNDKVDSVGRSLEETQERTRQNEAKITEVDQKAQAAATGSRSESDFCRIGRPTGTERGDSSQQRGDCRRLEGRRRRQGRQAHHVRSRPE